MTWLETVPTFLMALTVGLVPGLLLSLILGLRSMALVGSAPAFSVTSIALASIVAPMVGLGWGMVPLALTTLVLAVIVAAFRILWHRLRPHPPIPQDSSRLLLWAGLGVGFAAIAISIRFVAIFGDPENISQTYDNIFHLNAVRYMMESSNASSLTLGGLTANEPGSGTFYPAIWHALVAAVAQSSSTSIPVAVNAVSILIGAIYWPLGCVFLARQLLGPRAIGMVGAGVLSAAFGAFPYDLIDFGVLYPYFLGVSLLPTAIAYVVLSVRAGMQPTMRASRARLALLGVLPGMTLAHPSVLMALVALSVPLTFYVIYREYERLKSDGATRPHYVYLTANSVAVFALLAMLWILVRVDTAWVAKRTLAQSIGEAFFNAPIAAPVAWIITALTFIGVVALRNRRSLWWLVGAYSIAVLLFVFARGVPHSIIRAGAVGPWYGDAHRLAALLPVVVIPLAAIGLVLLHDRMLSLLRSRRIARAPAIVAAFAIALTLIASQGFSVQSATDNATESYTMNSESRLLTPDELDVLRHVKDEVPDGVTIAGHPWTGASLVYAFTGRPALLPHVKGFDTKTTQLLADQLSKGDRNPAVCAAADALGVKYVLDFGTREVNGGNHEFDGFTELATSPAVEPVYTKGDVGLYRLTAC